MKKTELIESIAEAANISKSTAGLALDAVIDGITATLKSGDSITLFGLGTFLVRERAARKGHNPRTGATIEIKAAKIPAFKAGKALKDAVQGTKE